MVNPALQEAIAALSDEERYELIDYIEQSLHGDIAPPEEATIAMLRSRAAEIEADPSRAQPKDEHLAKVRALLA